MYGKNVISAHRHYGSGSDVRRGYNKINDKQIFCGDVVRSLIAAALSKNKRHEMYNKDYIKLIEKGDLQLVKIVNNILRSSVIVSYPISKLNKIMMVKVYFKRYRKNTIDKFCYPNNKVYIRSYNLDLMLDCDRFVKDIENHMSITQDNLRSINRPLPLKLKGFEEIGRDSLYGFEIYSFDLNRNEEDPINSEIQLHVMNDLVEKDVTVKVNEIVNFNKISDLVGKYYVTNYKGAYKIRNKDDLPRSYFVLQ